MNFWIQLVICFLGSVCTYDTNVFMSVWFWDKLCFEIAVCRSIVIEIMRDCVVWMSECAYKSVCVPLGKMLKRRVLKEITPHSLRVLVTHALVVVERFPHLHSEVRDAAPAAPPVSTCPSRALLNHNLSKKKQQGQKKKKLTKTSANQNN